MSPVTLALVTHSCSSSLERVAVNTQSDFTFGEF